MPKQRVSRLKPEFAQASQTYADRHLCSVWVSERAFNIAGSNHLQCPTQVVVAAFALASRQQETHV